MSTTIPRAGDVLAVRSRVSWSAIAAGATIATAIYFILTLFGVALGFEIAARGATEHLGAGAAIYSVLTLLLSMFFGGWATSRLAVGESKVEAVLYGIILWGVLFIGLVWLFSAGVRTGFGAMVGLSSGAYTLASDEAAAATKAPPSLIQTLRRRYDTELGSEKFIADLEKAGFSKEQAKSAQVQVKDTLDRLSKEPADLPEVASEVAARPEVREAAGQVAQGARQAAWWTLLGVFTSLASVIIGALIGSGELLQPVPILGVRRPSNPAHVG